MQMKTPRLVALAPVLALSLLVSACPEPRVEPERPRPPQAALSAGASNQPDVLSVARPSDTTWFGVYLGNKKAGWQSQSIRREIRDGRDVLVARGEQLIKVVVGGKPVERGMTEERVYEARPGGRFLSFSTVFKGDGGDRTLSGSCVRERCTVRITEPGGDPQDRTVENVTETAEMADAARLAAARRTAVRASTLDTFKVRAREVDVTFVRRERFAGAGVQEEVSVVHEAEVGDRIPLEYRIADDGRILEIKQGDAIVIRPEAEASAHSLEVVDLFALGRVTLPAPVPRDVPATVTYRVAGLPAAFLVDDGRQRFEKTKDGAVLLTITARAPLAADPARDTPVARAAKGAAAEDLAPNGEVDSDAPAIQKLAREVAGDVPGSYAAALKLARHVHGRLQQAYGASHDRASDVLAAGRGDCTEHAVLTAALTRALGIPSRPVHGLVYARYADGQDALYWHAWVEVRSAGEWIAIDPIFDQPVADASHITLGRGTRVDTPGLFGALKVTSVEVRDATRARPAGAVRARPASATGVK